MSRMLAIIAAAGLVLCAVFLVAARLVGGDSVFHDPRMLRGIKPLIDLATRKEWHWAGGDTLALDTPMTLRYRPDGVPPGGIAGVTVTGPVEIVRHIHFRAGRIGSDAGSVEKETARPQAVINGIAIRKFVVNGSQKLELGHIDQDSLDLFINGSGMVTGEGKVANLHLTISDNGFADLGGLNVENADISILGNGFAKLSPRGDLHVFMAGKGALDLLSKPRSISKTVLGGGVINEGNEASGSNPAPPSNPTPAPSVLQTSALQPGANNSAVARVEGVDNVNLGHVDLNQLSVTVLGAASITGEGKVDTLIVTIPGAGNANLGKIVARKVVVKITGSGNAMIAPVEEAEVTILGAGNVRLLTKPKNLERQIKGVGRVIEAQ